MTRQWTVEQERDADEFAAAFLMPTADFKRIAERHRDGNVYDTAAIAGEFGVSIADATMRGRWLGLFSWY
jgi:Zn-dependent peptidase ImmA (M78 family)